MDFTQAILCLVTFNSTSAMEVVPGTAAASAAVCQQQIQTRLTTNAQRVDLDFHSRELKTSGEQGIMHAVGVGWDLVPE